ncbi:hypothetical protein HBF24_13985 [Oleiagrimonas sp. C23AA]|nr:hypothetical protein [Oleiagrimonas sp. C23AA]
MQCCDVPHAWADVSAARRDIGDAPSTSIEHGVARFVAWYRDFHQTCPPAMAQSRASA